ncbi:MAG: hypothetical protein KGL39_47890 [Patescibacteria group bacterium]|nr:hypothetical protein [Patescibacteria group bacterium]
MLDTVGGYITRKVGTMGCAILFLALSLTSLPAAVASHSVFELVSWTSQSFLQLVLLPIIMVGQRVTTAEHLEPIHDHHERHHAKLDEIVDLLRNGKEG